MRKILECIFGIFLCLVFINRVDALTVSKNNITIEKGKTNSVELYANVDEEINSVTFTLVYSTYDVVATFTSAEGVSLTNPTGITFKLDFSNSQKGKILLGNVDISVKSNATDQQGNVNLSNVTAVTQSGSTIKLNNQVINVKVGTPTEEEIKKENNVDDKNLLEKIESNITNITLVKDTFEYDITIPDDITELDLNPIAKSIDSQINISSQKIDELEDNKILITVSNNDVESVYTINNKVKVKEKSDTASIIDTEEFEPSDKYRTKWIIIIACLLAALPIAIVINKNSK